MAYEYVKKNTVLTQHQRGFIKNKICEQLT